LGRLCTWFLSQDTQCVGQTAESRYCTNAPCATWSEWSDWSVCGATCGPLAMRARSRSCTAGAACAGQSFERTNCDNAPSQCPQPVNWAEWTEWSLCTTTCGAVTGTRQRQRACPDGSAACVGDAQQTQPCEPGPACPIWTDWSAWSLCSVTCQPPDSGVAKRERRRICVNGASCSGSASDSGDCDTIPVSGVYQ
jgi:hypothetical protein